MVDVQSAVHWYKLDILLSSFFRLFESGFPILRKDKSAQCEWTRGLSNLSIFFINDN